MRNLIRRKILPAALAVLMLAATPALAFAANTDGEIVPTTYEIAKTASSDTVVPGGEISYTINVLIHGGSEEGIPVSLAVQDALPEGLEYVEGSLSWKGEDGLATNPSFGNGVLNAPLFTEVQGGGTEDAVYPGQSITFTYRAKADAELAEGTVLTNMAGLSYSKEEIIEYDLVSVTVVAPADDDPADSGAADADTTAKAENALDSSPKCGDTFLLGWLFKLLGIAN